MWGWQSHQREMKNEIDGNHWKQGWVIGDDRKKNCIVWKDLAMKPTAGKVEANHMTRDEVAGYSNPRATMCLIFPYSCLSIIIILIIINNSKRVIEVMQDKIVQNMRGWMT